MPTLGNEPNYSARLLVSVLLWHVLLVYLVYVNQGGIVFHAAYWYAAVPLPVVALLLYVAMFVKNKRQANQFLIVVSLIVIALSLIHNKFIELSIWAV